MKITGLIFILHARNREWQRTELDRAVHHISSSRHSVDILGSWAAAA